MNTTIIILYLFILILLGIDEDVKRFKNLIFTELSYKLPYEDIKFKEFNFYSRSMFNNDSINRLSHALSEQSKNIVIIASEDAPVISEVIDNVSGLSRRFNIKAFGYPVIRDLDSLDQKELFDLDILVYSPYWIDYSKKNVKQFNIEFQKKFHTQPLEKSYAWQGYDIAYYFLSGSGNAWEEILLNILKFIIPIFFRLIMILNGKMQGMDLKTRNFLWSDIQKIMRLTC